MEATTTAGSVPEFAPTKPMQFVGPPLRLVGIVLLNLLFTILTLGIYRFWARTKVRRYLWQNLEIEGEALEYTGRGLELFLGFLLIAVTIFLPLILVSTAVGIFAGPVLYGLYQLVIYLVFVVLIGMGLYRARRYRLSRTTWRGVRANQSGSSVEYGFRFLGNAMLIGLTLGWFGPASTARLWAYRYNNTWFGNVPFRVSEESGKGLYRRFAVAYLLALPTLYLSFIWYKAHELRTLIGRTSFDSAQFHFDATGLQLFWLLFVNMLIVVLTLGVGVPFAQRRRAQFVAAHLQVVGRPDLDSIRQDAQERPSFGEGIADALDFGAV